MPTSSTLNQTLFRLLAVMATFVVASVSYSQHGNTNQLVVVESKLAQDGVHPGSKMYAMLIATIQDGWHINSATPADENLIETSVHAKEISGIKVLAIRYPAGVEKKFGFADEPLEVYEGTVRILIQLAIAQDLKPGEYILPLSFGYQACNDKVCLAPKSVVSRLTLKVVAMEEPVSTINQDVFDGIEGIYRQ